MANNEGWSGEDFWQEVIENELYPPKAIAFMQGVKALLEGNDFSGKRVLDYGCGIGQIGKLVKERGADVVGVDISDKLLEVAGKHIKAVKADGTRLPFEDESFDYVMAFMVLHIIEDIDKPLAEIARVLKSGGKFFYGIVDPHSDRWDTEKGVAYRDWSTYDQVEERVWVFNLTDGRRFDETYIHRPFHHYRDRISTHLNPPPGIAQLLFPHLHPKYLKDRKYAENEFLLGEVVKK